MPLESGQKLGPYEILTRLGAGGMGEVYKAKDTRLDRFVAIKVISASIANDSRLRERLEREAKAISQLTHPNLGRLYDVGEHEGTYFLVLEFLDGATLAELISKGPLPVSDALRIAAEIDTESSTATSSRATSW